MPIPASGEVVPTGMFWYLPWDCLKDGRGRYLVERFNLTLMPPAELPRWASAGRLPLAHAFSLIRAPVPQSFFSQRLRSC